jgi:hypothetical protein
MIRTATFRFSLALLALCIAEPAQAATFTAFDPAGATSTTPTSIAASGAITGSWSADMKTAHGFLRQPDGTIVSFDPEGSAVTVPVGIDDKGRIWGSYTAAADRDLTYGFVRNADGKITIFDVRHSGTTDVTGFDAHAGATGYYYDRQGHVRGFVKPLHGKARTFALSGAYYTLGYARRTAASRRSIRRNRWRRPP